MEESEWQKKKRRENAQSVDSHSTLKNLKQALILLLYYDLEVGQLVPGLQRPVNSIGSLQDD